MGGRAEHGGAEGRGVRGGDGSGVRDGDGAGADGGGARGGAVGRAGGGGARDGAGARDAHPDRLPLTPDEVAVLTAVTASGGVALFPAETVYGLAADPRQPDAVRRLATLKGRDPGKPSSVLFWSVGDALDALAGLPDAVLAAVGALLPGPIGLIVPNPRGAFAAASGDDPSSLGVRVPLLAAPVSAPPVVQTSANGAGGPDPTTVAAVPAVIREACDLVLDRGPRPGLPSTIVDLRGLRTDGRGGWQVVREGPVSAASIAAALDGAHRG